jgi:hypothetical protein
MKKVLVTLFAITFALGVFAQDSTSRTNNLAIKPSVGSHEGVVMRSGKLLMMKNGLTTQLTTDLTLENGTVVMVNGSVKTKDGITTVLKEGDYVSMDGTTGNIKSALQPKDKIKDSTISDKMKTDSVK